MSSHLPLTCVAVLVSWMLSGAIYADDWTRFRGPHGSGVSIDGQALPVKWGEKENLKWKVELPGPGLSSPIVVGRRVLVTCWTGYGMDQRDPGEMSDLKRHLVCIERESGKTLWSQTISPYLPEDPYRGNFTQHGYASHTPVSDGKRVYAFFGKTGVVAFDLEDGSVLWKKSVGTGSGMNNWGTASSPILYKELVIVTAAAESESLVALDRKTGDEVWRQKVESLVGTWSTPILVDAGDGRHDLVLAVPREIWGLNPENGKLRWYIEAGGDARASVTADEDGVVYRLGARGGGSVAVRAGGRGDVSSSRVVWTGGDQSGVGTPIVHGGRLYCINGGRVTCVDCKTGERVYQGRLGGESEDRGAQPGGRGRRGGYRGGDYSSPVIADGKLYYVRRSGDGYVIKLGDKLELLATNRFDTEDEFSATPAVSDGQLFIRGNRTLFCVAKAD